MPLVSVEEFRLASVDFELSMDIKHKKNNGIYYTDPGLALAIIEFIGLDAKKSFFEPSCGGGSFVYAAKQYGFENIYAADYDLKAVKLCRRLTGLDDSRIKAYDTIGNDVDAVLRLFGRNDKFDYIIGNPPYVPIDKNISIETNDYLFLRDVKNSGSNLFVASIYRALSLLSENGMMSFIIPKNFLHVASYSLLRKMILKEFIIHSIIDIGAYFKGVRGEQIVLTIKNRKSRNNVIELCKLEDKNIIVKLSSVDQSFYNDELLFYESDFDFALYKKLESTHQKLSDVCKGYVGRGRSKDPNAIPGKEIRKFGFKTLELPKKGNQLFIQNIYSAEAGIIASFGGNLEARETVTVFTDGDEKMCRYVLGILHSRLCNYSLLKFCFNNSKLTMHADAKYLKKIPLTKDSSTFNQVVNLVEILEQVEYMSASWFDLLESLNRLVYNAYGVTMDESLYIDEEMKRIQSRRWVNDNQS